MDTLRRVTGIATAVVALVAGVTAGGAGTADRLGWQEALSARSDALNRHYGLGEYGRAALGTSDSDWQRALGARSEALNRKYALGKYARKAQAEAVGKVKVRITFKNDGRDVGDGSIAGKGSFTATGAIEDRGAVLIYRTKKPGLIILRDVAAGAKGTIVFVVKIDLSQGTSRWTITSGTRAYKGLRGHGTESENPPTYTVSILSGTVSR
jgi:hypothetical protein